MNIYFYIYVYIFFFVCVFFFLPPGQRVRNNTDWAFQLKKLIGFSCFLASWHDSCRTLERSKSLRIVVSNSIYWKVDVFNQAVTLVTSMQPTTFVCCWTLWRHLMLNSGVSSILKNHYPGFPWRPIRPTSFRRRLWVVEPKSHHWW